jgi:hypothetical protein
LEELKEVSRGRHISPHHFLHDLFAWIFLGMIRGLKEVFSEVSQSASSAEKIDINSKENVETTDTVLSANPSVDGALLERQSLPSRSTVTEKRKCAWTVLKNKRCTSII